MGAEPEPETQAPVGADVPGENENEDVVTDAQRLYEEGQVLYSAADYTGAIDKFTQVLALISRPEAAFDDEVRGMLLYNLATAHKRAFNVEAEPRYLRQARELYGRIVDEAAVHDYSDELVEQAATAREEVDQMLKEREEREREERAREETVPVEPTDRSPRPVTDPEQDNPRHPGRALTLTGIGVAGLGLAASGMWVAGLVGAGRATEEIDASTSLDTEDARLDAFDRGARSNTLIITGAVLSGALVATGVALVIAGRVVARRGNDTLACTPTFAPMAAGIGCALRF